MAASKYESELPVLTAGCVFQSTRIRKGEHPREQRKFFADNLQAYRTLAFTTSTRQVGSATLPDAQVRRELFDIHQAVQSPTAQAALDLIAAVYAIDNDI